MVHAFRRCVLQVRGTVFCGTKTVFRASGSDGGGSDCRMRGGCVCVVCDDCVVVDVCGLLGEGSVWISIFWHEHYVPLVVR